MKKIEIFDKIKILQDSDAVNYLETKERLFLQNILSELELEDFSLNEVQIQTLQTIFKKYKNFL